MENGEKQQHNALDRLDQVAEDLSHIEPVEPGSDPRRPNLETFEESDIGAEAAKYSEILDENRGDTAANDN